MRGAIPTLLGMGLSGLSFVGVDVGGFAEAPTPELYTRWLQSGLLYPFYRTHTTYGTPDQEPWSYGLEWEAYNRRAIEMRYELLPEIYNVMHDTTLTGLPAMRPLVLEYPDDPATYGLDDQYMFGTDLMLAPVLREGATTRGLYLPKGGWIEVSTGHWFAGGGGISLPVTMASIPLFARAGAFVFRQPVVQHTGQMPGQPLIVEVYGGTSGSGALYEDDGLSFKFEQGQSLMRKFTQTRGEGSVSISAAAGDGGWRPAARPIRFVVQVDGTPSHVVLNGTSISRADAHSPTGAGQSTGTTWSLDGRGFVVVETPDTFGAMTLEISR
jgi:alpha-glucosidase